MSDNVLNYAVATAAIVAVANLVEDKKVSPVQLIGGAFYVFGLSMISGASADLAQKLALLVLVGVMLTRGYSVLQKVKV